MKTGGLRSNINYQIYKDEKMSGHIIIYQSPNKVIKIFGTPRKSWKTNVWTLK